MECLDQWLWLIIMMVGLILAMVELLIGVDTGLDLVFVGSGFFIGGLITWPFHSWAVTAVVVAVICVAYVAIGRKYVHKWTLVKQQKTNVDALIGKKGIVLKDINKSYNGLVKVGNEQWRAIADEEIKEGADIEVVEIKGVTLTVKKVEGGN
jgi:membrane protein implicated in regulation of membrane protease activity